MFRHTPSRSDRQYEMEPSSGELRRAMLTDGATSWPVVAAGSHGLPAFSTRTMRTARRRPP